MIELENSQKKDSRDRGNAQDIRKNKKIILGLITWLASVVITFIFSYYGFKLEVEYPIDFTLTPFINTQTSAEFLNKTEFCSQF